MTTLNIPAMIAELNRRLDDPTRPPIVFRTEPLTPAELDDTLAKFKTLSNDHQDRLLTLFEDIAAMPEPEQTRAFEAFEIALDIVEEFTA